MSDPIRGQHPSDVELIKVAIELVEEGQCDHAVITIQTALEVYVEQRVAGIIGWRELGPLGDTILEHLEPPPYNFMRRPFRRLWTSLTGDVITADQVRWEHYVAHIKLRNEVVHLGRRVTEDEARASLAAALALMDHVQDSYVRTGVRLGKLR